MIDLFTADLKGACRLPGCPVCRLGEEGGRRYLFSLLWEYINDSGYRDKFLASRGYCRAHAWQLFELERTEFGDTMGAGTLYLHLAQVAEEELQARWNQAPEGRTRRWRRPVRPSSPAPSPCVVCQTVDSTEAFVCQHLAREIAANNHLQASYLESDGLCLRHLEQAAGHGGPGGRMLLEDSLLRLHGLIGDLEAYRQSCVYPRSLDPKGLEGGAPERALWLLAGPPSFHGVAHAKTDSEGEPNQQRRQPHGTKQSQQGLDEP